MCGTVLRFAHLVCMPAQDSIEVASLAATLVPSLGRAYYEMAAGQELTGDVLGAMANVGRASE